MARELWGNALEHPLDAPASPTPAPRLFTKNFTLLALGQGASLLGNGTLRFALSMYVLDLTGSAAVFSGMLAVSMVPTLLLTPFGGVLADRVDRRRMMVLLDFGSGAAVLAAWAALPVLGGLPVVTALLLALALLGALESPTVQACVPQLHSGDNLPRANAVVNQIGAVAGLVTPFIGSALYGLRGLRPVLGAAAVCFFLTALLECGIRLPPLARTGPRGGVGADLAAALRFLRRERPAVWRLMLLAAALNFFVCGAVAVGAPYLIRTVLGFESGVYAAVESGMGGAAIVGGLLAGIIGPRLRRAGLWRWVALLGGCLLPAGFGFWAGAGAGTLCGLLAGGFCLMQAAASLVSILVISLVQANTPATMTGKIMALAATVCSVAQPLGQVVYGGWFEVGAPAPILLLSGLLLFALGFAGRAPFAALAAENAG